MSTPPMQQPLQPDACTDGASDWLDPYRGNVLVERMGPILSAEEIERRLQRMPTLPPKDLDRIPYEVRIHWIRRLRWEFHVPSQVEVRLAQSIDLAIREGYVPRDPRLNNVWRALAGELPPVAAAGPSLSTVIAVVGISGTGKTEAVLRALALYPYPLIRHDEFPGCLGGLDQVLWQSSDVPENGRLQDLGTRLMTSWDRTLGASDFAPFVFKKRDTSSFARWLAKATMSRLGIVHLDEVQNLFKIPTKRQRLQRGRRERHELAIAEDQCVKAILSLSNERSLPLILSGTPDGIAALTTRSAIGQRLAVGGLHRFKPFGGLKDAAYSDVFMPALFQYQYVSKRLELTEEALRVMHQLTGGVQRLLVMLWCHAHRVAFERKDDTLQISDLKRASTMYMSSVQPAVKALLSRDLDRMEQYEDLMPKDLSALELF